MAEQELSYIAVLRVCGPYNRAFQDYLSEYLGEDAADMRSHTWYTMHILAGPANDPSDHLVNACAQRGASQMTKACLALRLVTPTDSTEKLLTIQRRSKVWIKKSEAYEKAQWLLARIRWIESSLLAFYDDEKDPMGSSAYQKGIQKLFPNSQGRFTLTSMADMKHFVMFAYCWFCAIAWRGVGSPHVRRLLWCPQKNRLVYIR